MKKKLQLMLFFLATTFVNAQTISLNCDFVSTSSDCDITQFSHLADQGYLDNFKPVVFNFFIWEIRDDNGNGAGDDVITDEIALTAIAQLNIRFNDYHIFFKYQGWDQINDSALYAIQDKGDLYDAVTINNEWINPNSFNLYIKHNMEGGGMTSGILNNKFVLNKGSFTGSLNGTYTTLYHEVGHCFGLHHTFNNFVPTYNGPCERVTRDPENQYYNADEAGDYVIDTSAMPIFGYNWETDPASPIDDIDEVNCEYIGNGKDCEGDFYDIQTEDVQNIMAYNSQECSDVFSLGQGIRMREAIYAVCPEFENKLPDAINTNGENGIASLYEPYSGSYFESGPNPENYIPLFQPGFDYRFVESDGDYPQPSAYDDISFNYNINNVLTSFNRFNDLDYETIWHPNHSAIRILQLENGTIQPRKSYNNFNGKPIGGKVTQFLDGVFNTNVAITPKDSLGVNNPQLIENLEPGLYSIEKIYHDGSVQENVIVKDNN